MLIEGKLRNQTLLADHCVLFWPPTVSWEQLWWDLSSGSPITGSQGGCEVVQGLMSPSGLGTA